jgi:Cysteine dioxygenase type I
MLTPPDHPLTPQECADLARRAAEFVDVAALDRSGPGSAALLWRNEHSEAWLNTWWEPRDTGYHDHEGSCVGVHVIEGRASNEGLPVGGARRVRRFGPGDTFWLPGSAIHRMDHDPGAVTVHVYAPPIRTLGHYDIVDGELHRVAGRHDEGTPPSPGLLAALEP